MCVIICVPAIFALSPCKIYRKNSVLSPCKFCESRFANFFVFFRGVSQGCCDGFIGRRYDKNDGSLICYLFVKRDGFILMCSFNYNKVVFWTYFYMLLILGLTSYALGWFIYADCFVFRMRISVNLFVYWNVGWMDACCRAWAIIIALSSGCDRRFCWYNDKL